MPPRELMMLTVLVSALAACGGGSDARGQAPPSSPPASGTLPAVVSLPPDASADDGIVLVEVQVIEVEDGDSLQVVLDGVTERVRLLGINAPERRECLGDESRDALADLVGHAAVLGLEPDARDQFGRLLAHVFADDRYANLEQVIDGLAIAFSDPNAFQDELIAAEETAERQRVGLWSPAACEGGPLPDGVEIVDLEPDPPGRDEDNLDREYVVIANASTVDVPLGGFVVRDESTANRYVFDPGFVLAAESEVRLVSGCLPPPGGIGWCSEGPIWNNGGDSAILLDPTGRVVDHLRYAG